MQNSYFCNIIKLPMKKLLFFSLLFATFSLSAQTQLKWNVPATLVLVPHIGLETSVNEKWTYQGDVAASFWKSFKGRPVQATWLSNELRFYPNESFKGFYAGPNLGLIIASKIRKPTYTTNKFYQKGYNIMMGATTGYMFHLSSNLTLDINVGGGFGQGFMKHYETATGKRHDRPEGSPLNKTGEWWPVYRAGVMLGFKL